MTAPRLLYTNPSFEDTGVTRKYSLKLSSGIKGTNGFSLTTGADLDLQKRTIIYLPGTELGGIIRGPGSKGNGRTVQRVYSGTTWTGILDEHILCPDEGTSHITVQGCYTDVINFLIRREGLEEIFEADQSCTFTISSMQLERHCTLYKGIRDICRSINCRPSFMRESGQKTTIGCVLRNAVINDGTNTNGGFTIQRLYPVNHLVCLGKGEGADRVTVHLYADKKGVVSFTQTLLGLDEIELKYDFSTAERDDLIERGTEKLQDLQKFVEVDVKAPDIGKYGIGDSFGILDKITGESVSALVEQIDVVVEKSGRPRYSFYLGDAEFGTS